MPVYLIAEIDPTEPEAYAEYVESVPEIIELFGGRFLVRGGDPFVLEGRWSPERLVVVEFPNEETLRAFYDSPEYAPLKAIRQRTTNSRLVVANGC